MKFSTATRDKLAFYVYALVDPRDETIFYVGKASANNRAFEHLRAAPAETKKSELIGEIRSDGFEPRVDILRYGLESESQCLDVEAAVIDAIGLENLTNAVRGHGIVRGRRTSEEVEMLHGSAPVEIETVRDRVMLFFINQTYSPTLSDQEVYDATRQYWHGVGKDKRTPDSSGCLPYPIALAVVDSVVVKAYSVAAWFPGGTTFSSRGTDPVPGRWEFVGQQLDEHELLGRRLRSDGKDIVALQKGYAYIN